MNIFKKTLPFILASSFLIYGCEQKELEPSRIDDEPNLFIGGKLNDTSFYYGGGVDSISILSEYSNYQLRDTIITWNTGFFKLQDLKIRIGIVHGYDPSQDLKEVLRNTIKAQKYDYLELPEVPNKEIPLVGIDIVDLSDNLLSTVLIKQPLSSLFEITEVTEVIHKGVFFLKAHIRFNSDVVSTVNSLVVKPLTNGEGIIVIGGV